MGNHQSFRYAVVTLIAACCWIAPEQLRAADWPTYRGDGQRSGYTSETLPTILSLRWTYKSRHVPRAAWSGATPECGWTVPTIP